MDNTNIAWFNSHTGLILGLRPDNKRHRYKVNLEPADMAYSVRWVVLFQVYDSANPSQHAETIVLITVQRNVNGPQFQQSEYSADIVETYPIGASVLTVNAIDMDQVSK